MWITFIYIAHLALAGLSLWNVLRSLGTSRIQAGVINNTVFCSPASGEGFWARACEFACAWGISRKFTLQVMQGVMQDCNGKLLGLLL